MTVLSEAAATSSHPLPRTEPVQTAAAPSAARSGKPALRATPGWPVLVGICLAAIAVIVTMLVDGISSGVLFR